MSRCLLPAVATLVLAASVGFAQEPPPLAPSGPQETFKAARDYARDGRFDLAAEQYKAFLAANPTDRDVLDIERKYGPTAFLRLRDVVRWSDNEAANADAKKTAEAIIAKSAEVNARANRNPDRVATFVNNLGGTVAERDFAIRMLKLAGDAAVPPLVQLLRTSTDARHKAGVLLAIPELAADAVPGLLAGFDAMPDDAKALVLTAIAERADAFALLRTAETDYTPALWRFAGSPSAVVRTPAVSLLESVTGGSSARKHPDEELVRLAAPFLTHTAKFRSLDAMTNKVKVWQWDAKALAMRSAVVPVSQAEEFYGLRALRWAVELNPKNEQAQLLFLTLAADKAEERAKFGDLTKSEAGVYQLLVAARPGQLADVLDTALTENRTGAALAALQVIGDRGQKDAPAAGGGKGTPVQRALSYPDPRVQFAAAVALLRSGSGHGVSAKVVDVLKRAVAADADGAAAGRTGRVLIADPSAVRGERLAGNFRDVGYAAERYASGRELLKRLGRAADYDLIALDRHTVDPVLADVLGQLASDPNAARRPVFIYATADKPKPVPFEHLLLRLAQLVAASETADIPVPPPYAFDPKLPDADRDDARARNVDTRNKRIDQYAGLRLKRLERLVEAAGIPPSDALTERLKLRLPQLTYAVLAAEFDVTDTSAPVIARKLADLSTQIRNRPELDPAAAKVTFANDLIRLMEQLENTLDADRRKVFEDLRQRVVAENLVIPADTSRDLALEETLAKATAKYPGVRILPEPYAASNLAEQVRSISADPAQLPRDPAERKATAKAAAGWLRRIALGEFAGFDVKPAEAAMRAALASDDLAADLIDPVARFGTADAQQDLIAVATGPARPDALRVMASEAAIRHVQAFGNLTPGPRADQLPEVAAVAKDATLKSKLSILAKLVASKSADLGTLLKDYSPPLAAPPPAKPDPTKDPAPPKDKEKDAAPLSDKK